MSNGFKDFSLRSLVDEYKVVNSVDGNGTLNSGGDFYVYDSPVFEGLIEKLTLTLDYEDITESIRVDLYIDSKFVVYMPIRFDYGSNQLEYLGKYFKIVKQDYKTLQVVIDLVTPLVVYNDFSLVLLALTSISDTDYNFTINYLTREAITIYG